MEDGGLYTGVTVNVSGGFVIATYESSAGCSSAVIRDKPESSLDRDVSSGKKSQIVYAEVVGRYSRTDHQCKPAINRM